MSSDRLRVAFWIAATHILFVVVTQLEGFFGAFRSDFRGAALFLARLPFLQLENLVIAVGLGGLVYLISKKKLGRLVGVAVVTVLNGYVALDQMVVRIFSTHFVPSMNRGATHWRLFVDSALAEVDGVSVFNVLLVVALGLGLTWLVLRRERSAKSAPLIGVAVRRQRSWGYWLVHYLLVSVLVMSGTETYGLAEHPLLALGRDYVQHRGTRAGDVPAPAALKLAQARVNSSLFEPVYGPRDASGSEARALAAYAHQRRREVRRPNIVLVVLESVGATQLLAPNGGFSPAVTPFLHSFEKHAVIFDSLYGIYPATTRAHQPINTGGFAMTWGGFDDAIECRYVAPTLSGELHRAGYHTALFSAPVLEAERLAQLLASVGRFDKLYDFGATPLYYQLDHRVHSWGGSEDSVGVEILDWLDGAEHPGRDRPFFFEFLTISTHHPYGTARGYLPPFKGTTAQDRYRNSLSYTDFVLKKLLENLAYRGLLDDTLVVLTGDHGEAFGDVHAGNFLHANHLYEENIRNFLVILDSRFERGPLTAKRVAASGDIMPTLTALAGTHGGPVLGQNLLSPVFEPRTAFFYKNAPPDQWGLRDGRWKFIGGINDKHLAELYDLDADSREQVNLAQADDARRAQVAAYDQRLTQWFAGMTNEYVRRLEGCSVLSDGDDAAEDAGRPGPKSLALGHTNGDGSFVAATHVKPNDRLMAWITWQSYVELHRLSLDWTSPGGVVFSQPFLFNMKNSRTYTKLDAPAPLEAGLWTLAVVDREGSKPQVLIQRSVTVEHKLQAR